MALGTAGLPVRVPATLDHDALIALMQRDKKSRDARPMFALPSEVGVMAAPERGCVVPATESQIATALGRAR
jgi:3-dehydroquinate synthetase